MRPGVIVILVGAFDVPDPLEITYQAAPNLQTRSELEEKGWFGNRVVSEPNADGKQYVSWR